MERKNDHVLQLVDAMLHEALEPEQAAAVERHCETCPICQAGLAEATKRFAALKQVPPSEAGDDLLERTEQLIDEHVRLAEARKRRRPAPAEQWKKPPRWGGGKVILATFATAAMLICGIQIYYSNLSPSPQDLQVRGERKLLAPALFIPACSGF